MNLQHSYLERARIELTMIVQSARYAAVLLFLVGQDVKAQSLLDPMQPPPEVIAKMASQSGSQNDSKDSAQKGLTAPSINMILKSPTRSVVSMDGRYLLPGSRVGDDWKVRSVEADRVIVQSDAGVQTVMVNPGVRKIFKEVSDEHRSSGRASTPDRRNP